MKANELMIGDWVEYRFSGWTEKGGVYNNYQYVQISSIGQLYIKADNDRVASANGEEFYPIPLTPEILEKNGWRQYGPYFSNDNADFELEPYRDGGFGIRVSADEYGSGTFACIKYVHQLQHALRLCGIEKEIEL